MSVLARPGVKGCSAFPHVLSRPPPPPVQFSVTPRDLWGSQSPFLGSLQGKKYYFSNIKSLSFLTLILCWVCSGASRALCGVWKKALGWIQSWESCWLKPDVKQICKSGKKALLHFPLIIFFILENNFHRNVTHVNTPWFCYFLNKYIFKNFPSFNMTTYLYSNICIISCKQQLFWPLNHFWVQRDPKAQQCDTAAFPECCVVWNLFF